jgi:uncharacterized protein (TIGR02453 family)
MPTRFPGFPPETLQFLRDLKASNNRDWFQAHKPLYDEKVKAQMVELVLALGEELQGFGSDLVTAPDKAIYRIYRDVRFSKDKSPYKTYVAAVFSVRGLDKHAGAGLYFHFSPDELLVGGGIYMPGSGLARLQAVSRRWPTRPGHDRNAQAAQRTCEAFSSDRAVHRLPEYGAHRRQAPRRKRIGTRSLRVQAGLRVRSSAWGRCILGRVRRKLGSRGIASGPLRIPRFQRTKGEVL